VEEKATRERRKPILDTVGSHGRHNLFDFQSKSYGQVTNKNFKHLSVTNLNDF
jgi:hypothetical protein